MSIKEEWRAISGFEGQYEVSSLGRVRSLPRTILRAQRGIAVQRSGRILKPGFAGRGYLRVALGANVQRYVSHLVLEAFVGARPDGCECAHRDGDKSNSMLSNLQWAPPQANHSRKGQGRPKSAALHAASAEGKVALKASPLHRQAFEKANHAERGADGCQ